jgi:hypothetical protein
MSCWQEITIPPVYRRNKSKTPAATANKARIVPLAGNAKLSSDNKPVKMSQMPNSGIPRFFDNLLRRKGSKSKIPAATASSAKIVSLAGKLILSRGSSPVRINQVLNKIIPRLLGNFTR